MLDHLQHHVISAGRPAAPWRKTIWPRAGVPGAQELFSIEDRYSCIVKYLGKIEGAKRTPEELINSIDSEKRSGNIAWRASDESKMKLTLSKCVAALHLAERAAAAAVADQ